MAYLDVSPYLGDLVDRLFFRYTAHRDPRVWGSNALEFVPERWAREERFELEKHFLGFSYGPRACIGRNVSARYAIKVQIANAVTGCIHGAEKDCCNAF